MPWNSWRSTSLLIPHHDEKDRRAFIRAGAKVGNFSIIIIDLESALNEQESIFDVFDCD
jgi:hypothetical protein